MSELALGTPAGGELALETTPAGGALAKYAISTPDVGKKIKALQENLGDGGLNDFQLKRLKCPTGGVQVWSIPTSGDDLIVPDFEGVIVYQRPVIRQFWLVSIEQGGNARPDCYSQDGKTGIGTPGGLCVKCPNCLWVNGECACPPRRMLFILREGSILPMMLIVPGGSMQTVQTFLRNLGDEGVPYYGAVTRFTLEKSKSAGGHVFAQIVPKLASKLDDKDAAVVAAYRDLLKSTLDTVSEYQVAEGEPAQD